MAQWMLAQQESSLLLPMGSFSGLPSSSALRLPPLSPPPPFPPSLSEGSTGWLLHWSLVGEWGGVRGGNWRLGWGRDGDELSMGSHLAPSFYSWGRGLLPLLDGGKSTGIHSGQGGKLWRPLGIGGKLGGGCSLLSVSYSPTCYSL